MEDSVRIEVEKLLKEIIKDSQIQNLNDESENITLRELDQANKRLIKNQEKLNSLCSKYPELGDGNVINIDRSFINNSLRSFHQQEEMRSIENDKNAYRIKEEYEQQKLTNAFADALELHSNRKNVNDFPKSNESPLIFETDLLDFFHGAFNGKLWKSVDITTFKDWFRVQPIGKPIFIEDMKSYFCYAIGKFEGKRDVKICPNMGKWITQIIGSVNHSSLKKKATDKTKIGTINEKFNLFA